MITITLLPGVNTLIIKKPSDSRVFITTPDSIIIRKELFIQLITSCLRQEILSEEILEGILEEYNSI